MKKKLMFLALGVLGLYASSNAQPPATLAGVLVNGAPAVPGSAIPLNATITYNGFILAIIPVPDPRPNDPFEAEQAEQQVTQAFIFQQVAVDLNGNGVNNSTQYGNEAAANGDAYFGFDIGNYTLQVVPFDFGISAVLGAGALAAVRTARKRRKEEAVA
jgi:hypothetical protein